MRGGGSDLAKVRGLGSAKHGATHWWRQRITAFVNIIVITWLVASLVRLPSLDYAVVLEWARSPLVAVPLILIVINTFAHFKLGLQVVIEDYQHGESRVVALGLLHLWTFGMGALALFSILKIAFSGTPAA